MAPELHSLVLRMYDRGEVTKVTVRPADLEALHLSTLTQGENGWVSGDPVPQALRRRCLPLGHG